MKGNMKYKKRDKSPHTKYERMEHRRVILENRLKGTGKYLYQNNTSGDLELPKVTESGRKTVRHKEKFIGDSYFMYMVPRELILLENLEPMPTNKLITEQPPTVTHQGKVEYVQPEQTKLNENGPDGKNPDVLLTEDPVGGIVIAE